MSLSPQSSRLLCLIAGLSTAGNVSADIQTLAARSSMDTEAVRAVVTTLVDDGLVSRELAPAPHVATNVECRLTFDGWALVDDMAAVNPRADLDRKQREYGRAAAAVSRFTDLSGATPNDGSAPVPDDFTDAVEAEELAKHRYDRALERYLNQQRVAIPVR